ncbi:c-type cytochrome [Porticoccaceae bacterium LTM1]|nr:c-type cytochrome [Porticoccaceae bacterium LTM1]
MNLLINSRVFPSLLRKVCIPVIGMTAALGFAADYPEKGDFTRGSKTWANNCARCHNMRNPSDLRDDQWITSTFHMRIRAGLTGQETRDILTFLQESNSKKKAANNDTGTEKNVGPISSSGSGQAIYQSSCVACHGEDGKGLLAGVPDLTDRNGSLSKADSELLKNITNGFQSTGSTLAMPPKGGNSALTDGDIKVVLKYIRETFGTK